MAVKRTGLGKGLDSMIPPKATQRAVKEDKNTVSLDLQWVCSI